MNDSTKDKMWILWALIGSVPGVVIWMFLVSVGIAGEFAGIVIGLGAFAFYRYMNCELKYSRLIIGTVILILIAFAVNHLSYTMDVYKSFSEGWYGAAGQEFTFSDASHTVYKGFLIDNLQNMRQFYLEAGIEGCLYTLLFWIALFIYYRKVDEIEQGGKNERE